MSQSEWSDEQDSEEEEQQQDEQDGYTTDDPALENVSMINENGLTDAEGKIKLFNFNMPSFVNNNHYKLNAFFTKIGALSDVNSIYAGDDDVSLSSRASSRLFDSDNLLSVDSLNTMFDDSEYEFSDTHLKKLRSMSESIARSFGQQQQNQTSDSD